MSQSNEKIVTLQGLSAFKGKVDELLANKENSLTTQTAYSAKGSATKVPQITTNSKGQVTLIEEVTISQPTVNNGTLTIKAGGSTLGTFTANNSGDVEVNITASDLGLSSALKFIGTCSSSISDGSTTNPVTVDGESVTAVSGNCVYYGAKEFVWNGTAWKELGDTSSHALKTVTVTGSGVLSGGGTLETNRTITHNEVLGTAQTTASVSEIKIDKYGHISESNPVAYASTAEVEALFA